MKVIESWDVDANFWEVNPQLKVPGVFRKLYDEDKSKSKAHSSKLMWAVAFIADFDSKYRNLSEQERYKLVAEDILKEPEFDFTVIKDQLDAWDMFRSVASKQMIEWDRLMTEKTIFMKTLSFTQDNAKWIEERLIANVQLYKAYEEIMERLNKEGDAGIMWGGGQESLLEKGEI